MRHRTDDVIKKRLPFNVVSEMSLARIPARLAHTRGATGLDTKRLCLKEAQLIKLGCYRVEEMPLRCLNPRPTNPHTSNPAKPVFLAFGSEQNDAFNAFLFYIRDIVPMRDFLPLSVGVVRETRLQPSYRAHILLFVRFFGEVPTASLKRALITVFCLKLTGNRGFRGND